MSTASETLVEVSLGERSYPIIIGNGILSKIGEKLLPYTHQTKQVVLVTDAHVAGLHLETVKASIQQTGTQVHTIILPAGEATKSFEQLESLMEQLLGFGIERQTPIVALGGGVIGDITGFAASIALRGIPFIQIPTTLLAQVDSSVGGKTAINSSHGKNLIGTFYQPSLVLIDVEVLQTLPKRELLCGYAEVVKYGLLGDAHFFEWLEEHAASMLDGKQDKLIKAIAHCCQMKAEIVAQDEREAGKRALLNLDHTFGHALEKATGYSDTLLHGEAVAIGCIMAFYLSLQRGHCPKSDLERMKSHWQTIGLQTDASNLGKLDAKELLAYCYQDKKVSGRKLTFVLANHIGEAFVTQDITEEEIQTCFEAFL